jgi:glycosyltransferase involved in cell wall biosynthesis
VKISVIMPTLNSAKYLKASLDSLAAQTFKEFEVLAIDSGSTDETMDIFHSYGNGGVSARLISAPDLSPALARNIGIENAAGEYIAFCDSDDIMRPNMLKTLYEAAVSDKADIAVCDFDMVYPEKTVENFADLSDEKFELSNNDIVDYDYRFCAAPRPNNYVWSRLYKRGFPPGGKLLFPSVRYSEDHLFNLSALLHAPRIVHIGESLYCYMQRDDSAMRKHIRRTNHGLLFLEAFLKASEISAGKDSAITEPILAIYVYTRVKSILFYAWQAKLLEKETLRAVSAFTSNAEVKRNLSLCVDRDYIGRYCRLHGFSGEWEGVVRAMLGACIDGTAPPDMREVFA